MPDAMEEILASAHEIARIAAAVAPPRRHWAVVGSGPDRIAAVRGPDQALRAVLPLDLIRRDRGQEAHRPVLRAVVLVCAAGLPGPNADDVAKEVAIYRAHKAAPVVIAAEGEAGSLPGQRGEVIPVPPYRTCRWRSSCRRWSATCSATKPRWPSTPRPGRCARPGRPSRRARRPAGSGRLMRARRRRPASRRRAVLRAAARRAATTAISRRPPRCGWCRCCGTRTGVLPLEGYELEYGQDRSSRGAPRRPAGGPQRGHRRADPPRRRHQAPGQDRHRRHLAQRGRPASVSRSSRPPWRGSGSRHPWLSGPAHPRRPRRGGRGGRSASPGTGSTPRRPALLRSVRRSGRVARGLRRAPRPIPACAAPSTGPPRSGRSPWRAAPATAAP